MRSSKPATRTRMATTAANVMQTDDATIVEVNAPFVALGGVERPDLRASGTARRHPTDTPNPEIGVLLAHARAYEKVAKRLHRKAAGLIKHADDVRNANKPPMRQITYSFNIDPSSVVVTEKDA